MEKSYEGIKTQKFDLNLKGFEYNSISSSSDSSDTIYLRIKDLIDNNENFGSDSQSSLESSNDSSVLEFLIPQNPIKLAETDEFASSSPIFWNNPKNFSDFHSKYNEDPKINIRIVGESSEVDIKNDSSAEDIKIDLEAFNINSDSLDFEGNLELDEAIVIDNEGSKSSSSTSGELLKDLVEEFESPEKFKTNEFYGRLGESPPEIIHQAVSLLPDELFEEKIKKGSDLIIKVKKNDSNLEDKKAIIEDDNLSKSEKEVIRNSLTDEKRDSQRHEDPKGQCSCNKCYIL